MRDLGGTTMVMSAGSRGIGLATALAFAHHGDNAALLAKTTSHTPRCRAPSTPRSRPSGKAGVTRSACWVMSTRRTMSPAWWRPPSPSSEGPSTWSSTTPARPHRQHPDHDDEEVRLNAQVRLKARGEHPRDLAAHEPGAHLRESGGSITALSPPLNPLDGIQADAPEVLAEDLTGQAKAALSAGITALYPARGRRLGHARAAQASAAPPTWSPSAQARPIRPRRRWTCP